MRKNYIDNLRSFAILLLIPYHTFMLFNNWGEKQFIEGKPLEITSYFVRMIWSWFMPMLFLLAGISAYYALKKRNVREFLKERVLHIILPFISGIILYIPLMSYIADVENNGYSGGYFAHYKVFFTRWTDLSGTDGGFTPAHLWFILYLFAISIISLAIILPFKKSKNVNKKDKNTPIIVMILLGIIPLLVSNIANIDGKSLAEYFIFYIFGYYIFSKDENIQRLFKYRYLILSLTILNGVLYGVGIGRFGDVCIDIFSGLYGWLFLLSVIGFSSKFFNFSNKIMKFLRNNSFLIYQFHYPILIIFAYIFRSEISESGTFLPILIVLTFIFTIPISLILGNIPGIKTLFGKK